MRQEDRGGGDATITGPARRADRVDKELPALIDTARNASPPQTLGINVDALAPDARPDHVTVESRRTDRYAPTQRDSQRQEHEEASMASKSAHKEDRKKQASSLKEKRAAKKAKQAKPASLIPPTSH